MRLSLLSILSLFIFTTSCQSKDKKNYDNGLNITVEFINPVKGFHVKIYWTLTEVISEVDSRIKGPARLELERISDGKKFRIDYKSYSISDSVCSSKIQSYFEEKNVPDLIQLNYSENEIPDFFLKDVNFDNKEELIITETAPNDFIKYDYRVFEFTGNIIVELKSFPSDALKKGKGDIDYEKKEITTIDYLNCCVYTESFYKYEKSNIKQFIIYKTAYHDIDPKTNSEEVTIEENGKKKIVIFKKNYTE